MKQNVLSDREIKQLVDLGCKIKQGLDCNANNDGLPCRTDRLDSVENMKKYLEIHGYKIKRLGDNNEKR